MTISETSSGFNVKFRVLSDVVIGSYLPPVTTDNEALAVNNLVIQD